MNQRPIFQSFDHINVRVEDLDQSIQFYTEILGFTYLGQRNLAPVSPTISAYVQLGQTIVELAWGHNLADYHTDGMINHFALTVPDIDASIGYLKEKGVEPITGITNVNDEFYCYFIQGPSGERFEIIQYLK